MSQAKQILENIINDFSVSGFIRFFREKSRQFVARTEDFARYSDADFANGLKLGEINFAGGDNLIVCSFEVKKELSERAGKKAQYEKAKNILKSAENQKFSAGIFIFSDAGGNFRFSLVYPEAIGARRQWSNFRRFTYFVSREFTNKTFLQRIGQGDFGSLEKIKDAFSVEKVTKEFYENIANWYFWTLDNVKFPEQAEDQPNGKSMSVIRLITRLIFIWFMRERGLVPKNLFEEASISAILKNMTAESSTYYLSILQNLFFATLSTKKEERQFGSEKRFNKGWNKDYGNQYVFRYQELFKNPDEIKKYFGDVPFLNGGLFECLDNKKEKIYIDGFSRTKKNQPNVPNFLFFSREKKVDLNSAYGTKAKTYKVSGLLDILSSFNFTIDENSPDDADVALDPELLGRVFENLLASFNPETFTTARKATGSYYTPREIVDYMVTESLKAYFKTHLKSIENIDKKLESLFSSASQENPFDKIQSKKIVDLIESVKIVDPAVGSGAFPMGALNKLVFILGKIDPCNKLWQLAQLKATEAIPDPSVRRETKIRIEEFFQNKNADYGRKLYLIQRCIYGVDIQQIAVEIAKLRFFIALLVDEKIDKKQENWGIEPLPNLDFKIMQGNSLLEELVLGDTSIKLFDADIFAGAKKMKNLFEEDKKADLFGEADKQQAIVQKLNQMHRDYFALSDLEEKDKLKVEIDKIEHDLIEQNVQKELKKLESDNKNLGDYITPGIGMQKEHAVKFQKNLSKQVQIMNVLNDLKNSGVKPFFLWRLNFAEVFENGGFDVVIGNPPYVNIFNIKDENYRNELKNKYKIYKNKTDLYAFFAEKGLDLLKKNGKLVYIFSNSWLGTDSFSKFRELLVNKTKINKLIKCQTKVFEHATVTVVIIILSKEVVNKNEIELLKFTEKEFKKLDFKLSYDFIRRQVAYGFTFDKPLEIKIPFVKLGEIAKFSLGIKTSDNKRFISNSKKSDASYKILRGKDIGRYFKKFNNKWIWYKPDLMNQRKGAGPRKLDCFLRTKILIKDIATEIHATLDTGNYLIVDTINIIYEVKNYDLKFILAILNSKLINKWFKMNFTAGLHIKINQLEHIPIPNKVDQAPFITLVNKILAITKSDDYLQNPAKQAKVKEYEKRIDEMVYKLYGLGEEEIKIVEK